MQPTKTSHSRLFNPVCKCRDKKDSKHSLTSLINTTLINETWDFPKSLLNAKLFLVKNHSKHQTKRKSFLQCIVCFIRKPQSFPARITRWLLFFVFVFMKEAKPLKKLLGVVTATLWRQMNWINWDNKYEFYNRPLNELKPIKSMTFFYFSDLVRVMLYVSVWQASQIEFFRLFNIF